jgi:YD repeat-containing protein
LPSPTPTITVTPPNTAIVDPDGNVYRYSYDASGDLVGVDLPGVAAPAGYQHSLSYSYDSDPRFTGAVDPRGDAIAASAYYPCTAFVAQTIRGRSHLVQCLPPLGLAPHLVGRGWPSSARTRAAALRPGIPLTAPPRRADDPQR